VRVAELAARQHGVVSRRQLRELGVTDSSIAKAVATGRLHSTFRGVFGVGHPPSGQRSRMLAAVLACGDGAVVSHRTAAALLGLLDRAPAVVEVIAPNEAGRGIDGIRRHHVPPPLGDEAGTCDAVPCTSPSRTLVDLAGTLGEHSLRRAVERAAVLQILDVPGAERAVAMTRRRGGPVLRTILNDWRATASGSDVPEPVPPAPGRRRLRSGLEARLLTLIGAAGLPNPVCNRRVEAEGKGIEVDLLWPDQRLVVEADGRRFHENPLAFEGDRLRDRVLHLAGYRVVRFTHLQIEKEADEVISTIHRLLSSDLEVASTHARADG
jgi:very-short-patch-repair endonuclease